MSQPEIEDLGIAEQMIRAGRPRRPELEDEASITDFAHYSVGAAMGYYACGQDERKPEVRARAKLEMQEDIDWIVEHAARLQSAQLYRAAAQASDIYSVWYCFRKLGEDKTPPLARAVELYERTVALAPDDGLYRLDLAGVLYRRPQVRDLERARTLAESVKGRTHLKSAKALLAEINRREGKGSIDPDFRYDKMTFSPTCEFTREQRTCRAILRQLKKSGNPDSAGPVVDHLYRLAVLYEAVQLISVLPWHQRGVHYVQLKSHIPMVREMRYTSHGRIIPRSSELSYLTATDYRMIEAVYGGTDRTFDPRSLLAPDLLAHLAVIDARIAKKKSRKADPPVMHLAGELRSQGRHQSYASPTWRIEPPPATI